MPISLRGRLVFSVFVILAWFGLIAEGAHALYSDTAALSSNSVSSGSVDLQVSNSQSATTTTYADSRIGFSFYLNPGESDEKYFFLKNVSTSNSSLDIDVIGGNPSTLGTIADAVTLEFLPVDSTGVAVGTPVAATLRYFLTNHVVLGTSLNKGDFQRFKVKALMSQSFSQPGASITYDLMFTGTQHVAS